MKDDVNPSLDFDAIAPGFQRMFAHNKLTLGLFFPIESYFGDIPAMTGQLALARKADEAGFAALWTRDVPLRDPSFGDVGQIYDPWVWLGYITAATSRIALATGSIVLALRHPLDVAKAAASIDNLSNGRLVLGIATGDRPVEFPAYGRQIEQRGTLFVESLAYIRRALQESFPVISSPFGTMSGADLIPKPSRGRIPIAVTGHSQQSIDWIAANSDAWIMYPRTPAMQAKVVRSWKEAIAHNGKRPTKPFAQSLYIDLTEDPNAPPQPIHLGFRLGRAALIDLLHTLEEIGVNHVAFNLKYGKRPAVEVVDELCQDVLPCFPANLAD
ncbi:MAG: LLM class oxidoreductase [Burkholderiaceae bacterium]